MSREVQRSDRAHAFDAHFECVFVVEERASFISELFADIHNAYFDVEWSFEIA